MELANLGSSSCSCLSSCSSNFCSCSESGITTSLKSANVRTGRGLRLTRNDRDLSKWFPFPSTLAE